VIPLVGMVLAAPLAIIAQKIALATGLRLKPSSVGSSSTDMVSDRCCEQCEIGVAEQRGA